MTRKSRAVSSEVGEEVARLLSLLSSLIRLSKRSQRELEREMGLGNGALSKLLSGRISAKLQDVLMIAACLDLTPEEFFFVAYPDRKRKQGNPLVQQVLAAEGWAGDGFENGDSGAQLERLVDAAVERALQRRQGGGR